MIPKDWIPFLKQPGRYLIIKQESEVLIHQSFCIQESWEDRQDIKTFVRIIDDLLTMLKGLSHLLENQGSVGCMFQQRDGLLASISIKLLVDINGPLVIWAPSFLSKASGATWWCRSSSSLSLYRFQTPRNVSSAACSIIEVFLKCKYIQK